MGADCPFHRAWCVEADPDPADHVCRTEDVELASGWSVTRMQADDESAIYLADPDMLLPAALTGRLSIPDALDLIAALAAMVRDASPSPTHHTVGA